VRLGSHFGKCVKQESRSKEDTNPRRDSCLGFDTNLF
jgi:hypothetical protein